MAFAGGIGRATDGHGRAGVTVAALGWQGVLTVLCAVVFVGLMLLGVQSCARTRTHQEATPR
jgi:hypothetical protein